MKQYDRALTIAGSDSGGGLFASPEGSVVEGADDDSSGFSVEEQSPERSRMRHTLDKTTGNVLTAFGGLAGGLVHGVQQGAKTVGLDAVGRELVKGVQTVGQTTVAAAKEVGT